MVSGVLDANLINSKDAILDAAEMLMARVGYDKASISQICRESKLPVGSIYHHFGSKAGLLSAVIERGVGRFFSALRPRHCSRTSMYRSSSTGVWLPMLYNR